jgi:hypothetical protein
MTTDTRAAEQRMKNLEITLAAASAPFTTYAEAVCWAQEI